MHAHERPPNLRDVQVTDLRELMSICREYVTALQIELARREQAGASARQLELAAYFTHCDMQPIHAMLALRSAMVRPCVDERIPACCATVRGARECEPRESASRARVRAARECVVARVRGAPECVMRPSRWCERMRGLISACAAECVTATECAGRLALCRCVGRPPRPRAAASSSSLPAPHGHHLTRHRAQTIAYKAKHVALAGEFARRLLEMSPAAKIAQQANRVVVVRPARRHLHWP